MSQLKARCIEQVLTFENTPVITSGNVNYDSIVFDFCSAWDGFIKTAIFYRSENEVYHQLLDEANTCLIPNEVLTEKGDVYIGVFGVSGETTLTSQVLKYKITKGAITENLKPSDPTPDIYAQIVSKYNTYDERLSYFEERFNGSAGDAEFLEGHDADYFATAESVEALKNGTTPAGDSNKLGGHESGYFAPLADVSKLSHTFRGQINVSDFNEVTEGGIYYCVVDSEPANAPLGRFTYNGVLEVKTADDKVYQTFIRSYDFSILRRARKNATEWTEWKTDATTSDLANYFPLTGGTVNGTVSIKGILAVGDPNLSEGVQDILRNANRSLKNELGANGDYALWDSTNSRYIIKSTRDGTHTFYGTASGITGNKLSKALTVEDGKGTILELVATGGNNVYTRYVGMSGTLGLLGFVGADNPVLVGSDGATVRKLHHDGNSAKVHIGDTAPNDTTGQVLFINTSS